MSLEIHTITVPFVFRTTVNCYLIRVEKDFVLIDTARAAKLTLIEKAFESAECKPGNLKLIVLTHGDFDHSGNAAYLRQKYGASIVMHEADNGMVERGDMFWNRNSPNLLVKTFMGMLFKLPPRNRFKPDYYVQEGDNLLEDGFDAEVIEIPGHSKGSIGLKTGEGDLFCGDLLANVGKPDLWSIIDDPKAANSSVEKLKGLGIKTVYPGHGDPFPMQAFLNESKV